MKWAAAVVAVAVVLVTLTAAALHLVEGLDDVHQAFVGGASCGGVSPTTDRDTPDEFWYKATNLAMLAELPRVEGARIRDVRHSAHHRCPDATSDVVGWTTVVEIELPPGIGKCDVARTLEAGLSEQGFRVDSLETSDGDGTFARYGHGYRPPADVDYSIPGAPTTFAWFIDHDSQTVVPDAEPPPFPCG